MKAPAFIARRFSGLAGERGSQLLPQARLAGPMPWVIAIMIALTSIAAAGGLALNNLAEAARAELSGGVTVQIVEASPTERTRQAAKVATALAGMPGVSSVRVVPEAELEQLIEPWLGDAASGDGAIPVPALIDVRLSGQVTPGRLTELRGALTGVAPAARVDAHAGWLGPVFAAIASLQWLALALIALLAVASVAAVWLAARSALGNNHETIEVVHHLGGTDAQIARIFQRSVARDAMLGGFAGLALGLIAVFLLARRFAALGSGMIDGAGLGLADWVILGLVPVAGVVLAALTARFTVIAALRRML